MPRKGRNVPCSHTTRAGKPCRAWAVKGTDPPACAAHAGLTAAGAGAPLANQNARTHGFYGRTLSEQELADLVVYAADLSLDAEIACARVALRRTLEFIRQDPDQLDHGEFLQAASLIFQGTRTIALLLRDRQTLSAGSDDTFLTIIDQALDELSKEWGIEL
jgi:hypothetical protein